MNFGNLIKGLFGAQESNAQVELLSMHIPKTAGITFREILFQVYGREQVLAVNRGELQKMNKEINELLNPEHRVVHGHLHFNELKQIQSPDSRLLTWFREPVTRVISNYYYNITHEYPKRKKENPDLKKLSLEEFIEKPNRINVMCRFMEGIDLKDVYFLGFQESFADDLQVLAKRLEWPQEAIDNSLRLNDNRKVKSEKGPVSESVKDRIRELNKEDIDLYERALALKESGYWRN